MAALSEEEQEFLDACEKGEAGLVRRLLSKVNPDVRNADNATGFLLACRNGHVGAVRMLLASPKVDVNAVNSNGESGLILASMEDRIEVIRLLVANQKVDVGLHDHAGFSAIMWACNDGRVEAIEAMISDSRVDLNKGLVAACKSGEADVVKLLLRQQRCDPGFRDRNGENGFIHACYYGRVNVIRTLLAETRIDPNVSNAEGLTGFLVACQRGQMGVVELLLSDAGRVDISLKDGYGAEVVVQNGAIIEAVRAAQVIIDAKLVAERIAHLAEEAVAENLAQSPASSSSAGSGPSTLSPDQEAVYKVAWNQFSHDEDDPIGDGHFGIVYRGSFRGTTAAVKIIRMGTQRDVVVAFQSEVRVWAALPGQKNILQLLAFHESPRKLIIITELADGGNLRNNLASNGWDWQLGLKYLRDVARGMAFLHGSKVLHGDLKPDNVVIDEGVAKIGDFGLSKLRQTVSSHHGNGQGHGGGTPGYIAPEVYETAGGRPGDVYSFAMIVFEVGAKGERPFAGVGAAQIMYAVVVRKIRPRHPFEFLDIDSLDSVWKYVELMWHQDAGTRPKFEDIRLELDRWVGAHGIPNSIYGSLGRPSADQHVRSGAISLQLPSTRVAPMEPNSIRVTESASTLLNVSLAGSGNSAATIPHQSSVAFSASVASWNTGTPVSNAGQRPSDALHSERLQPISAANSRGYETPQSMSAAGNEAGQHRDYLDRLSEEVRLKTELVRLNETGALSLSGAFAYGTPAQRSYLGEAPYGHRRPSLVPVVTLDSAEEGNRLPYPLSRHEILPPSTAVSKLRISASDVHVFKEKLIGQGGFSTVYEGLLRRTTRVAVKVLRGLDKPRQFDMFQAEIRAWEGLTQRNILPLIAFTENPPMMISELCTDGNMRQSLARLDWDSETGLRHLRDVVQGMSFLHSLYVIHGDLKSANVLIDRGVAKISDFGLSWVRHAEADSGSTENAAGQGGTPGFMAPELYQGERLMRPADVYAFSMICYEVASEGQYPWAGLMPIVIMQKISMGQRPDRPNGTSDPMWRLMQQAWAGKPEERPDFVEIAKEMDSWV